MGCRRVRRVRLPVTRKVPFVGKGIAIGVRGSGPIEVDHEGRVSVRWCRFRVSHGRAVNGRVRYSMDRTPVEAHVEQVTVRSWLEVDGARGAGDEGTRRTGI